MRGDNPCDLWYAFHFKSCDRLLMKLMSETVMTMLIIGIVYLMAKPTADYWVVLVMVLIIRVVEFVFIREMWKSES